MEILATLLIATALAMDCFAVSLAAGTVIRERKFVTALVLSLFFGLFQSGMALAGWEAGVWIAEAIGSIDHWIAFVILAVIGGKMVHEGLQGEEVPDRDYLALPVILILSVATSIDSLGVGLSLALISTGIARTVVIIGGASLLLSFAGVMLGSRLAARFGRPAEVGGGIILILIGTRILLAHLGVL